MKFIEVNFGQFYLILFNFGQLQLVFTFCCSIVIFRLP